MKRMTLTLSDDTFAAILATAKAEQLTPIEVVEDMIEKAFAFAPPALADAVRRDFAAFVEARQAEAA